MLFEVDSKTNFHSAPCSSGFWVLQADSPTSVDKKIVEVAVAVVVVVGVVEGAVVVVEVDIGIEMVQNSHVGFYEAASVVAADRKEVGNRFSFGSMVGVDSWSSVAVGALESYILVMLCWVILPGRRVMCCWVWSCTDRLGFY